MNQTTQGLLFCVLFLCGLQEAAAASQRGRCARGLCFFQHLVDFRAAEESCSSSNGQLVTSSSKDQIKLLTNQLAVINGRYWLHSSGETNCTAVSVTSGENATLLSEPCRDQLDGFVCHFQSTEFCGSLNATGDQQVTYAITMMSTRIEVVDSEMFPPGTVAVARKPSAKYPDAKHLCFSQWLRAPWKCEVLGGGCENGACDPATDTCTCPDLHAHHPNNFSCEERPTVRVCRDGYKPAADGGRCVDVDECEEEEDTCTAEGQECANTQGGYECLCAHGFEEEDGECVNVSICHLCEHMNCSKIDGEYRCVCKEGFKVSSQDPTKCEQHCPGRVCPAICHRNPQLEQESLQQCRCPDGYILDINNRTANCIDINECEHQKMCDHKCENLLGSYRCLCDKGFRLEGRERCVPLGEGPSGLPFPPAPVSTPGSIRPAVLPSYIKTGSVLGITVFMLLCVGLLGCLLRYMTKHCGKLTLTSIKHPDIDIFYLQQVTTETYKRLSFDKQSKTDSLRL